MFAQFERFIVFERYGSYLFACFVAATDKKRNDERIKYNFSALFHILLVNGLTGRAKMASFEHKGSVF